MEGAKFFQDVFHTERFRVYAGTDVIGMELGGALKNVIAIAAGVCDGLGFGDNTKGALLTRGLAEISRLGVAMGAGRLLELDEGSGAVRAVFVSLRALQRALDEALEMGVEPAGNARQQRREQEDLDLGALGIDTHRLGHHGAALERPAAARLLGGLVEDELHRLASAIERTFVVVGVPDERFGEIVVALVQVTEGHVLDEAELKDHTQCRLGKCGDNGYEVDGSPVCLGGGGGTLHKFSCLLSNI